MYETLQKDFKRVGQAFQNQKEQNQELTEQLAEMQELQRRGQPAPQEDQPTQQPKQTDSRVSAHSLASIHDRYDQVLQCMRENKCSMACAFRLASCPRSTLRDFVAIAELKKVDSRELDLVLRDQVGSVRALEVVSEKRLGATSQLFLSMYYTFWMFMKRKPRENIQVCHNVSPTSYRQVTDILPTHYQLSPDCWWAVGRL
ncbi:unnamed protein product [Porites lobata]|uniref:Uncharacterized protein n=1 Tax=Porites lobata TaxID=104759 RepID=A0ABN8NY46_9CNID|nr:unnamed protein product [Porites lobata]